jgi:hypothetical protein
LNFDDILKKIQGLSPEDRADLERARAADKTAWLPNPGPQRGAMLCKADELFYGGQAGGGKTDLLVGLSLTAHKRSLVLRRTNVEATKLVDRYIEVLGGRDGWNGQDDVWRTRDGRVIDIRGCQHEDDKQKYKGTPHDLIAFDEISDFSETQYRFIIGWNRSTDQNQRCRIVATGNPPTRPEGLWVLQYWAPWLDKNHPRPAKPGELRWFTTIEGRDTEVDGPGPHTIKGEAKPVIAKSRTFIPASLADNPDLARTNYRSVLAGMPEELRAAYLEGRFDVAMKDAAFQVIPTSWVEEAQARWNPNGWRDFAMTAMGLDPAGGGQDAQVLCWRHGGWYAPFNALQGKETADGSFTAATVVRFRRDSAPVIVDIGGGYGGAVTVRLRDNGISHVAFNGSGRSMAKTRDGSLGFANKRAEAWWKFREELDPDQIGGSAVCLPPDPELKADLTAPRYEVSARGVLIEDKDSLRTRLGRSTGRGDACVMAMSEGNAARRSSLLSRVSLPKVVMGHDAARRRMN